MRARFRPPAFPPTVIALYSGFPLSVTGYGEANAMSHLTSATVRVIPIGLTRARAYRPAYPE